ncbi:MAG: peptide/nickel transport system permease protein, partial [Mycobacterium sp.]|nr:peptide/nickel transport system permease protein [Mycobacterium sp.]
MAVAIPAVPLVRGRGRRVLSLPQSRSTVFNWIGFSLVIVVTLIVIAVPLLAPYDPLLPVGMPLQAPGKNGFLLGTDSVGRDIFSRVLYGARSSWFAALVVVAVGLLIGGLVGLIAGTAGGWVDTVLMRITDGFLSLPAPVLAIAVVAALGPGFVHTLVAVSIVWWPFYARLVRGEVARLAARPHVEAAKLAGVSRFRLAGRHLLPGAVPNTLVAASLDIGTL